MAHDVHGRESNTSLVRFLRRHEAPWLLHALLQGEPAVQGLRLACPCAAGWVRIDETTVRRDGDALQRLQNAVPKPEAENAASRSEALDSARPDAADDLHSWDGTAAAWEYEVQHVHRDLLETRPPRQPPDIAVVPPSTPHLRNVQAFRQDAGSVACSSDRVPCRDSPLLDFVAVVDTFQSRSSNSTLVAIVSVVPEFPTYLAQGALPTAQPRGPKQKRTPAMCAYY